MLEILQIPVLKDNYIYLLHDPSVKETAVVDPALAQPVLAALEAKNWTLSFIFNTHHHADHVGGNLELKQKTGCRIFASAYDKNRIPGLDKTLSKGDKVKVGAASFSIIETPGHTLGHILYYCASENLLFCGDTLFAMGCGRLFEGTAEQMFSSLQKIRSLPEQTKVYCAHEYTQSNGYFALTVDGSNKQLRTRMTEVDRSRRENKPTIPSTIEAELATNPFLRTDSRELQQSLNATGWPESDIFAEIRRRKDRF